MTVLPNEVFIQTHLYRAYWWILLAGLLLTMLMVRLLSMQMKGRLWAERLVQQRTAALQKSEAKFRGLVESSGDWIWEVNAAGVYTYASPQIEARLGYKPEEVIGKATFDLMPPEEAERIAEVFRHSLENGNPFIVLENINLTQGRPPQRPGNKRRTDF